MVELAAVGPEGDEAATLLCKGIPLEPPLVVLLDGASTLVLFRPGVMSFQVTPPSAVESKRPLLEQAQPCPASLKLRLNSAAPLGTSGDALACVSVSLPLGPSFRSVGSPRSRRFGATTVESTTATMGKFAD